MKRDQSKAGFETLANELADLRRLDGPALKGRWRALYATEPPARIRTSLLLQAVAYRLQEKALGGLKPSTRHLLERVAQDTAARPRGVSAPVRKLEPGTVLVREWRGATHQVTVLNDGVLLRGERYRSLSGSRAVSPAAAGRGRCSSG